MDDNKKSKIARLCQNCREVANADPALGTLLREVYDQTLGINARDEPVIMLLERVDLHIYLPRQDRDLLYRLQRPASLDFRNCWFHWFLAVAMVYNLALLF